MLTCIKMEEITEKIAIPEGISCKYESRIFICKNNSAETSRRINLPSISIEIKDNEIIFNSKKSTKNERKVINTQIKHIENMFSGLSKKFFYKLEACNVHFPMSVKIEGGKLAISNFLGEKVPRYAKILPDVDVQIKGPVITVESANKEAAGQTAANIEKATVIRKRDKRIFQDGIYITQKPGDKK